MSRKTIVMILVLASVFVGTLTAQESVKESVKENTQESTQESAQENTPSVFDIGIVMNYSYEDIQNQNFSAYVPTLQVQWNLLPWFGISATGHAKGQDFAIIAEAVFRAPLGIIEPYIAVGPGFLLASTDDIAIGTSPFVYNVRAGIDFNITDWFSVGPGITFLIHDVQDFYEAVDTLDVQYLKENCLIGIGAKVRF